MGRFLAEFLLQPSTDQVAEGKERLVGDEIEHVQPFLASAHHSGIRQQAEVLGNIRLPGAGGLDEGQPVILMCRSGKRSAQAVGRLSALGFTRVQELEGGFMAWEQAGLPVEKDARAPWDLERQVRFTAGLLVLAGLGFSLLWPPAIWVSWFVAAGLVFSAITDWCGMGLLLAKMPWNRSAKTCGVSCQR